MASCNGPAEETDDLEYLVGGAVAAKAAKAVLKELCSLFCDDVAKASAKRLAFPKELIPKGETQVGREDLG